MSKCKSKCEACIHSGAGTTSKSKARSRSAHTSQKTSTRPGSKHARILGELLKLGIEIGQTSVAKYMARRRGPPPQGWQTFLRRHRRDGSVTISFRLLYGLLIVG